VFNSLTHPFKREVTVLTKAVTAKIFQAQIVGRTRILTYEILQGMYMPFRIIRRTGGIGIV
jgi:hypothetical protein